MVRREQEQDTSRLTDIGKLSFQRNRYEGMGQARSGRARCTALIRGGDRDRPKVAPKAQQDVDGGETGGETMMSTRRGCRVLYAWLPLAVCSSQRPPRAHQTTLRVLLSKSRTYDPLHEPRSSSRSFFANASFILLSSLCGFCNAWH